MNVKLLTQQHLEFLSLKGCYTGSSESTLVKMPHCSKFHVTVHISAMYKEKGLKEPLICMCILIKKYNLHKIALSERLIITQHEYIDKCK